MHRLLSIIVEDFLGAAYFSTHQLVGAGVCVCVGMRVYVCVCAG